MVARVNELPWQQDESLYLSHFLRHRKLKFSIQIPPDLRKEFFFVTRWIWLPLQHKSFILSATVEH